MLVGVDEALQLALAAIGRIARDPARHLEPARHDPRLDAVLVLEPVRDDLELQLADRAEQQHRARHRPEHLDRAFFAVAGFAAAGFAAGGAPVCAWDREDQQSRAEVARLTPNRGRLAVLGTVCIFLSVTKDLGVKTQARTLWHPATSPR